MLERIKSDVEKVLGADTSGHSVDHVERVHRLSMEFAKHEKANPEIVSLIAWLHDVDDYKLFGRENALNLTNAKDILARNSVDTKIARQVLRAIPMMGYNNSLEGIRPDTLEGQIVSDADMSDAIGAQGLIRVFDYNASKGRPFFVKSIKPMNKTMTADEYRAGGNDHAVQHFFDKLLLIPGMMMTEAGRLEGEKRAEIMVSYLRELFREEGAQDWELFLDDFLTQLSDKSDADTL